MRPPSVKKVLPLLIQVVSENPGRGLGDLAEIVATKAGLFLGECEQGHEYIEPAAFYRVLDRAKNQALADRKVTADSDGRLFSTGPEPTDATNAVKPTLNDLAKEAGFKFSTFDTGAIALGFECMLRACEVIAWLSNGWLCLRAYIMRQPQTASAQAALSDKLLRLNSAHPMTKYALHDANVYLELEYREEHVDPTVFERLVRTFVQTMDSDYPSLYKVASGDETLQRLEKSFKSGEAA